MTKRRLLPAVVFALAAQLLASGNVWAQSFSVLQSFAGFNSPRTPYAGLVQASDGNFYGTISAGGPGIGYGGVFRTTGTLYNVSVLHWFQGTDGASPAAGLIQGTDGKLYGTTGGGGPNGYGTVFNIDLVGNLITLHSFGGTDGGGPYAGLIQGSDGNFYGTTLAGGSSANCFGGCGTVFKIDPAGNLTTLHSFTNADGADPYGGLVQGADGNFYGTTAFGGSGGYGTVFTIDSSGNFATIYSFAVTLTDGFIVYGGLVQGSDGYFYGTTFSGGPNGGGTVFRIDTLGNLTTLYSFAGPDGANPNCGLILGSDGNFYGTTQAGGSDNQGVVFRIDSSGNLTTLHSFSVTDGADCNAVLFEGADGNFYGTTVSGGGNNEGTVFEIDVAGDLTTLVSFGSGAGPFAAVVEAGDGYLYGTTSSGGTNEKGTVFRSDLDGNLTTLHSFLGSDGQGPIAGLIAGSDGFLYGTTGHGGANNDGTVFKIDPIGDLTSLYSFAGADGQDPEGGLVGGRDGYLYGTTVLGGSSGLGTIFRVDTSGNLTTIHSFSGSDGALPYARLVQASDDYFYGTTNWGGLGNGTVFRVDSSGNLTTLHSFTVADGASPYSGLIEATDDYLYGTTYEGGMFSGGTAFRMDRFGNLTTLHSFGLAEGESPYGGLVQGSDGYFYGVTSTSGAGLYGTVFRLDSLGNLTPLHFFALTDGAESHADLVQASDGNFYGTTFWGGDWYQGVLFRVTPCASYPSPEINPTEPIFCPWGSVILDAGPGYSTYRWSPSGETTESVVASTPGTWSVTVSDSNGCLGTASVAVTEDTGPIPVITPLGPTTFCPGESVTLDAGAGYATYQWTPNGETTQTIVAGSPGIYTVTVTDGNGCAGTSPSTVVTVVPNPTPVVAVSQCIAPNTPGQTASSLGYPGDSYTWTLTGGTIDSGQGTNQISFTSGPPGTAMSLTVVETNSTNCSGTASATMETDFSDVAPSNPFYNFICTLARNSITGGCGGGNYCPAASVLRSQMAVFLLRSEHGSSYVPPACTVASFTDVPCSNPFSSWIYQLVAEGITSGCTATTFCPNDAVLRNSMAVFLLVTEHGTGYTPPTCTPPGQFTDVPCPGGGFTDWIYQLVAEGITGGCTATAYCPSQPVSRAQMSVFLVTTFSLP
jgi:uncharacterized repeat protein (TIGR03803 family)